MPRRVIYIKNPTSGSHFRTIGSGSGPTKKQQKALARRNVQQSAPGGWVDIHNVFHAGSAPTSYVSEYANWFQHEAEVEAPDFGQYTGPGIGPYDPGWTDFIPETPYKTRRFKTGEKIIGIGAVAIMALYAPEVLAVGGTLEGAAAYITTTGFQGGAVGVAALSFSGIEMSILDAPINRRRGDKIVTEYPDLFSWWKSITKDK